MNCNHCYICVNFVKDRCLVIHYIQTCRSMTGDFKNSADEVDSTNYKSYMEHQKIKLEAGQLVLTNPRGEFKCPFCSSKTFKVANRASLQKHALSLRGDAKTIKGRAEHLALAHYMVGPNLPPIGQRSQKKRKFY